MTKRNPYDGHCSVCHAQVRTILVAPISSITGWISVVVAAGKDDLCIPVGAKRGGR
jgi:hypothetical protein